MTEIIEFIAKKILPHPDNISVNEQIEGENDLRITLFVDPEDIGLAIGKAGKTANAIREILKIKATGTGQRIFFDIKPIDK